MAFRIKAYFLPPIPKPRITGIDPLLLKVNALRLSSLLLLCFWLNFLLVEPFPVLLLSLPVRQKGNLDEINLHLSSFHNYRPPSYSQEVWEPVNKDKICLTLQDRANHALPGDAESVRLMAPCNLPPVLANQEFLPQSPTSYVQSVSPYRFALSSELTSPWPGREVASPQGVDYTTLGQLGPQSDAGAPTKRSPQDFYTCVQQMNDSGEVHLVPCLPPEYCQELPPWSREQKEKMAVSQLRMDSGEAESSGSADPLVCVAVDNQG